MTDASEQIAKTILEEIDNEILVDILARCGWVQITIKERNQELIEDWCKESVGKYMNSGARWIFKDEKDAVLFALRWA